MMRFFFEFNVERNSPEFKEKIIRFFFTYFGFVFFISQGPWVSSLNLNLRIFRLVVGSWQAKVQFPFCTKIEFYIMA